MQLDVIHNRDCADMAEIGDSSIDLIVTGPPYWSYINYNAYVQGQPHVWSSDQPYKAFLDDLQKWGEECWRVLKPGRYAVFNLGTVRRDGRCYPLPYHAVPILEKADFEFAYEVIWHKVSGGRRHARNLIQTPLPGYYLPNNRIEYLLFFRKKPEVPFLAFADYEPEHFLEISELFKLEIANNVWHIMPPCHEDKRNDSGHPCPFPPEIPIRLIQLLTLPGETVLDPFMGVGTTARAARMLGRHFVGYEKEPVFIRAALAALDVPLKVRRPTVCRFELLQGEETL